VRRAFDLHIEHYSNCGRRLAIIAAIEEPRVIGRILRHLVLPARAPPSSPACLPQLVPAA